MFLKFGSLSTLSFLGVIFLNSCDVVNYIVENKPIDWKWLTQSEYKLCKDLQSKYYSKMHLEYQKSYRITKTTQKWIKCYSKCPETTWYN